MANFNGTRLTNKGRDLLARAIAGTPLQFTRVGVGDGVWPTGLDPLDMIALASEKKSLPIESIEIVGDGTVKLRFILTNRDLAEGFFVREIGIFANDPDLGEILYAVTYAGNQADYIPASGVVVVESVTDIYTVISNAENVTAYIPESLVFATIRDLEDHNISPEAHQDIRALIATHETNLNAHPQYIKRYTHVQDIPDDMWRVPHNLNTSEIPIIRAYKETIEEIAIDLYSGSGATCGDGTYCGGEGVANARVETEIPIFNFALVTPNILDIRFTQPQSGKAVILV